MAVASFYRPWRMCWTQSQLLNNHQADQSRIRFPKLVLQRAEKIFAQAKTNNLGLRTSAKCPCMVARQLSRSRCVQSVFKGP